LPGKNGHPDLKKAVSYIILVFFLFNSVGYYLLFELDMYLVKKEMNRLARKATVDMTILKITDIDHNPEFSRPGKREIEYKGMLYDVVREIRHGSGSVFVCLHDSKEEGLFAGLRKAHFHKLHLALWDHVIKIAFPEQQVFIDKSAYTELNYPILTISLQSSSLRTWSPPPELS
jgi:hypothetical protein